MSRQSKHASMPDLEAMSILVQKFEGAVSRFALLSDAELDEVLRFVAGKRAIFQGQFNGKPAIFRFYLDQPETFSRRDWAELNRTYTYMSQGNFRVNLPLFVLPELGLLIVEHVTGQPLLEYIWQAGPDDRNRYFEPAALWLRRYTKPTERRIPAQAAAWLARAKEYSEKQPFETLRSAEVDLIHQLDRISAPLDQSDWRVAICHGDFHPNNLLVDGSKLTGIDTGGSAKLPLYKDMARFLTHMGRRRLIPSGKSRFGVDALAFDAFVAAFELDDTEREVWLPFMIGVEALMRVESKTLSPSRISRSEEFYEELLMHLREIGP